MLESTRHAAVEGGVFRKKEFRIGLHKDLTTSQEKRYRHGKKSEHGPRIVNRPVAEVVLDQAVDRAGALSRQAAACSVRKIQLFMGQTERFSHVETGSGIRGGHKTVALLSHGIVLQKVPPVPPEQQLPDALVPDMLVLW